MKIDPYKVLGITPNASPSAIKAAYRDLVKLHHPDAGGDSKLILAINAAWEILGNHDSRLAFDLQRRKDVGFANEAKQRANRNVRANELAKAVRSKSSETDQALCSWLKKVYQPIDRSLGKIINSFPAQLKELSADPYDDILMESFSSYLEDSQTNLEKMDCIYRSINPPSVAKNLGFKLYQCLSLVQDAFNEFNRYTMGYVDSYLNDGHEMLREAKKRRSLVKEERRRLAS